MCLAIPGKIIEIDKNKVIVDYGKEKREGRIISNEFNIGDYVIVQAGIVIQKVPKGEALKSIKLFDTLKFRQFYELRKASGGIR